jgi:HSP20 family protein
VHRFERTYGTFERTFVLPSTVDPDQIEARYDNGVLLITIPKAERAKPREIRVKASASGSPQVRGAQSQRRDQGAEPKQDRNGGESASGSQRSGRGDPAVR